MVILVTVGGAMTGYAKERKLTREMVPAVVLSSFQKRYPQASVLGYEEEVEHGKTFYEIESKDGAIRRDILFVASGEIAEIEEVVPNTDVPLAIQQAGKAQFPQAEIHRAEKVTRGGRTYYEIGFKQGEKHFSREFDLQDAIAKD